MHWQEHERDDIDFTVELRTIYDGWSIALLKTGQYVNRWANPKFPNNPTIRHRREAAEAAIREYIRQDRGETMPQEPGYHAPQHDFIESVLEKSDQARKGEP